MTRETLQRKIKKYRAAAAAEKAAKAEKEKIAAEIMAEYTRQGITTFDGVNMITTSRESIKKADVPEAIWNRFKSVSTYSYLTPGRKA